jgi:hypothetical protein
MKTTTDVTQAVEFLRWMFGDKPNGYIYIFRSKPSSDPVIARQKDEEGQPKQETDGVAFSAPERVDTEWWRTQGHHWSMMYCTATVKEKTKHDPNVKNNQIANTVEIPALWCDIDGCKEAGIPADEFYADIHSLEDTSAWVRSSERGLQCYFKLDKPFVVNGDKALFEKELEALLYDMALYYGGDWHVCNLGRNMRLPGSLNIKPEYKGDYFMAQALAMNDKTFSLAELRERFKVDADTTPRVFGYACTRALQTIWDKGSRHDIMLGFYGSVRKGGLNKEAAKRLGKEIQKYFQDDDRSTELDTTYAMEIDGVATLRKDFPSIVDSVDRAIKAWVALKVAYCKQNKIEFHPENIDPTQPVPGERTFYEEDGVTMYAGNDGDPKVFCNFVIRLKGRLIKADTKASVWLAEIHITGEPPTLIELSTADHSQWQKFLAKTEMPTVGLSILAPKLWAEYIAWLQRTCPDMVIKETPYYGWLGVDDCKPTLVLPDVEHDEYSYRGHNDTAFSRKAFTQEIASDDVKAYLKQFIAYYKNYHEDTFIWPALGWFAASSVKGLIDKTINRFPVLVVNGLTGSGKSYLIEEVLAVHYGTQSVMGFEGSTSFALRTKLGTNNLCPLVLGEFRTESGNDREAAKKVKEVIALIRASWGEFDISRGQAAAKELVNTPLEAPWCLVGEHQFGDPSSIDRCVLLTIDRKRANVFEALPAKEKQIALDEQRWLQDSKHRGWLGAILVQWAEKHIDEVLVIARSAREVVDKTCPCAVQNKRAGVAAVLTGLVILRKIYWEYGLKDEFPLPTVDTMLPILYAADVNLQADHAHDTTTLKHLFEVTDGIIIEAHRASRSYEGSLYVYDLDGAERYIYVDTTRWFRLIRSLVNSSDAATLTDRNSFQSLIKNHQTLDGSPFIEFMKDHPVLGNCVKIDLERVKAFGVNTAQWKGIDGYQE